MNVTELPIFQFENNIKCFYCSFYRWIMDLYLCDMIHLCLYKWINIYKDASFSETVWSYITENAIFFHFPWCWIIAVFAFEKDNGKKVIKNKNWNLSSVWLTVIVHARSFLSIFLSILYYTWASLTIYLWQ